MDAVFYQQFEIEGLWFPHDGAGLEIKWANYRFWGNIATNPRLSIEVDTPDNVIIDLAQLNARYSRDPNVISHKRGELSADSVVWIARTRTELAAALTDLIYQLRAEGMDFVGGYKHGSELGIASLRVEGQGMSLVQEHLPPKESERTSSAFTLLIPSVPPSEVKSRSFATTKALDDETCAATAIALSLGNAQAVPRSFSLLPIADSQAARGSLNVAVLLMAVACEQVLKHLIAHRSEGLAAALIEDMPSPPLKKLFDACSAELGLEGHGVNRSTLANLAEARNKVAHKPTATEITPEEYEKFRATTSEVQRQVWKVLATSHTQEVTEGGD